MLNLDALLRVLITPLTRTAKTVLRIAPPNELHIVIRATRPTCCRMVAGEAECDRYIH